MPDTAQMKQEGAFSDMVLDYKLSKNVFCKFDHLILTPWMKPFFAVFSDHFFNNYVQFVTTFSKQRLACKWLVKKDIFPCTLHRCQNQSSSGTMLWANQAVYRHVPQTSQKTPSFINSAVSGWFCKSCPTDPISKLDVAELFCPE